MTGGECSPGEQSGEPEPDLGGLGGYLEACRSGAEKYSIAGAARAMGVSRAYVYRMMSLSAVSEEVFEEVLDGLPSARSLTAVADAIKRRAGNAREYEERCPHCGEVLRVRHR